jgi:hypothetical protein
VGNGGGSAASRTFSTTVQPPTVVYSHGAAPPAASSAHTCAMNTMLWRLNFRLIRSRLQRQRWAVQNSSGLMNAAPSCAASQSWALLLGHTSPLVGSHSTAAQGRQRTHPGPVFSPLLCQAPSCASRCLPVSAPSTFSIHGNFADSTVNTTYIGSQEVLSNAFCVFRAAQIRAWRRTPAPLVSSLSAPKSDVSNLSPLEWFGSVLPL